MNFEVTKTFLCSHLVVLRWKHRETAANLEKISSGMLTVNAEEALPVGIAVMVLTGTCELAGTIVHCETDPGGYYLDVALEREWSPELFSPEHLFDLESLASG